jgi:hypothetical protein
MRTACRVVLACLLVCCTSIETGAQSPGVTRVGIIGLDTSHSPAFTKLLNDPDAAPDLAGFRVVVAYPYGSRTIESSYSRIPRYIEEVRELGVEVVDSIDAVLSRSDVVLLMTNDGRLHLEQALQVFKAGKPVFIDKPLAGSLADAVAIVDAARQHGVPVFSSSSLRYTAGAVAARSGTLGRVVGADAFSPATIEPTHPDLFWYGVHGVELLFTAMGTRVRGGPPRAHSRHRRRGGTMARRPRGDVPRHPRRTRRLRWTRLRHGRHRAAGPIRRIPSSSWSRSRRSSARACHPCARRRRSRSSRSWRRPTRARAAAAHPCGSIDVLAAARTAAAVGVQP